MKTAGTNSHTHTHTHTKQKPTNYDRVANTHGRIPAHGAEATYAHAMPLSPHTNASQAIQFERRCALSKISTHMHGRHPQSTIQLCPGCQQDQQRSKEGPSEVVKN